MMFDNDTAKQVLNAKVGEVLGAFQVAGEYREFIDYYIWLTTENGLTRTNQVALEPEVLRAFEAYIRDLRSLIEHAGGTL